jgi:hypothetical protein
MSRYLSRRHQTLMDESEQALLEAAQKNAGTESRIAKRILGDSRTHGLWEARHAELVRPVAEEKARAPQIMALRDLEVRLVHRRALIEHIRENEIRDAERERLFSVFYSFKEFPDAVLAEHREYVLAVSSRVCADHLIDIMQDPPSRKLLRLYETTYARYFEMYCYVVGTEDTASADAAKLLMTDLRHEAERVRRLVSTQRPDNRAADFERQAVLARSGRHRALNYLGA